MTIQLDLFGQVEAAAAAAEAADAARLRNALVVLRDVHRHALELVIGDRRPDRGQLKTNLNGPWAYSVRRQGLYYEDAHTWDGWYTRPKHLVTWDELDDMTSDDRRLGAIRSWSEALTAVDAWRDRWRPYELDWEPDTWHPGYPEMDHARAGWRERHDAWTTVLAVLTDAIGRVQ